MEVMHGPMPVSHAKWSGGPDCGADEVLAGRYSIHQWEAPGEPRCDGGRQGAAGAMRVARLDAGGGEIPHTLRIHENVRALPACAVAALHQNGSRTQGKDPLGLSAHGLFILSRRLVEEGT